MRGAVAWLAAALLAAFVVACDRDATGGGRRDGPSEPPPIAKPAPRPGLWIIGNDQGRLRPCGCTKPLVGGIIRRTAFFESLGADVRDESLVIACGNMIVTGGRQQELKIESFLEVLALLDATALLMADGELQVGSRFWDDILASREPGSYPLVSLNLARDGKRLFESHAVVEWGGAPLVLTSWTSPDSNKLTEPGVDAQREPDLSGIEAALAAEGARLFVFTTADPPLVHEFLASSGLADRAAGVLVSWSGISDVPVRFEKRDDTLVLEMGTKGRWVGWTSWPAGDAVESYTLEGGDHAEARAIFDFYREGVAMERLIMHAPRFDVTEGEYVGTDACTECHAEAVAKWKESKHSGAWKALVESGDDKDPECVGCHVVGWGETGGFDPIDVTPVAVQCEACHGPSSAHVKNPESRTPRGRMGERACIRCHDLENSPEFDFAEFWFHIRHK